MRQAASLRLTRQAGLDFRRGLRSALTRPNRSRELVFLDSTWILNWLRCKLEPNQKSSSRRRRLNPIDNLIAKPRACLQPLCPIVYRRSDSRSRTASKLRFSVSCHASLHFHSVGRAVTPNPQSPSLIPRTYPDPTPRHNCNHDIFSNFRHISFGQPPTIASSDP